MKRRKLYIGLAIGLSLVLTFAGGCMYWQAHQGDVKSIIYLNPMQEATLSKDDFDAFEKLVSSVEKTGIRIENPEMRAGSYNYSIIYRNGKEKDIGINAVYCYINGTCYASSQELCDQLITFFEDDLK